MGMPGARLPCNSPGERCFADGCHPMRLLAVILFALLTAACDPQQDITGSTPSLCALRSHSAYNPRDMNQCIAACKTCDNGNTVTCTTSCTLKGAR